MIPTYDDDHGADGYSFAYLDEQSKREIRRALLKAVAIPGYQVPFSSTEMPLPPGWGTGGLQITASIIGRSDVLKVIDQGADDSTNATSIRNFFAQVADIKPTTSTHDATIVQTRHRIPERALRNDQILVLQVPQPEPLRRITPRSREAQRMHAFADYGRLKVLLYEDIARHGQISTSYDYPVLVNGRYVMSPSPVPKFDNPKLHRSEALMLFGAGRERRVYALPPFTTVQSLDFEDRPFFVQSWPASCSLCGSPDSYLDELVADDSGRRSFVCSDTDYCASRRLKSGGSQ
ncbi:alpha-D-ribose 1-methylphosphonate 5-phosphate C-P-lyase PhnJ [Burkholderia cepacia]|uniref:alpha-D-ribose 1-methylphosphonate 5-phosphate C-P-lyase PhnJ n=1 Tax=Burkholderia cepacia TaxID=292 RepID=UPI002AB73867|nr:alpha-D-ribose 1-methylphosphonate 5-phosphate C-P-lyase PhnJ [Burkholderia cepacia]